MKINVHIERLVLDGVPVEQRHASRLRTALEQELIRLLCDGGPAAGLSGGGALPRISAGAIKLDSRNDATEFGRDIARAVYEGIGR